MYSGGQTLTVTGTAEPIATHNLSGQVWLTASPNNAAVVYVGGSPQIELPDHRGRQNGPVATSGSDEGFPLNAGETLPFQMNIEEAWFNGTAADRILWTLL